MVPGPVQVAAADEQHAEEPQYRGAQRALIG
jgi:hypothetical protein